jgi:PAS domain S-box-containing protein
MAVLDQEKVDRIKRILKWHPRGMTISDISSSMALNRNLTAKYLDMLLISGQVEVQMVGAAKVYFLARRVPISAMLEFSSDLVIVVDNTGKIIQVNEQVPALLDRSREELVGRRLDEIDHALTHSLHENGILPGGHGGGERVTDFSGIVKDEMRHFRIKQILTAFEDGSEGFTFIIEDITTRKRYEQMLEISEARYRGLVQSSGEAIIGNNPEGGIVSWNPAAEQLFGYTESEVLGKPIHTMIASGGRQDLETLLISVVRGGGVRRQGLKMVSKQGLPLDVVMTISPIAGENGGIIGTSLIIRDITRELMEQNLREHEDRYRTLVEDINVGIYRSTSDPRGRFVWGNTALLRILGYDSMPDLKEVNVINIFSEPEGRLELLDDLHRAGFVKNRVLHLKRKDGNPVIVNVTALAEFDEHNNMVYINGIVQDITGNLGTDTVSA